MPQSLTSTRLRAPVNVTWEITDRCNLRCRHCLSADLRRGGGGELDRRSCEALIDELAAIQVFQINFGGGEPFLRDDFMDILRYAQSKGIVTCVSTNGTRLTEDLVDELVDMELLFLQVSLDGAHPETNDAIRGAGTFDRITEGDLVAHAAFVLRPEPQHGGHQRQLPGDRRVPCARRPVRSPHAPLQVPPFRRRIEDVGSIPPEPEQLAWLSGFLGEHEEILTGDSFFSLTNGSRRRQGLRTCGAARMTCAVGPDGSVFPCAFLCEPTFLAGNVAQESLASIFEHAPIMGVMRDLEVEPCQTCDRFSLCNGGCPAVAHFVSASLGLPDPECLRVALPHTDSLEAALPHTGAELARTSAPEVDLLSADASEVERFPGRDRAEVA